MLTSPIVDAALATATDHPTYPGPPPAPQEPGPAALAAPAVDLTDLGAAIGHGASLTAPQTDTSVVKIVTGFLGFFAILGLLATTLLGWKLATTGVDPSIATPLFGAVTTLTGTSLGALGTLLASTKSTTSA